MGDLYISRIGDSSYGAVHLDCYGTDKQRAISAGGSEQVGARSNGYHCSEGVGSQVVLDAFHAVLFPVGGCDFGVNRELSIGGKVFRMHQRI